MITASIVLGSGIDKEGNIGKVSLADLNKAIELYKLGTVNKIILSGKYKYGLDFVPPITEANALMQVALKQGVSKSDLLIEDKSETTVSNFCRIKINILIPSFIKSLVLISPKQLADRRLYNLKMVLGNDYQVTLKHSNFKFKNDTTKIELQKLKDCKQFFKNIKAGDHKTILKLATKELKEKYIKKV